MMNDPDVFIRHRLRSKPIEYTVSIRHFVSVEKWMMSVKICNVDDPNEVQRERIAADLRYAAELVESAAWNEKGNDPC